MGQKGNFSALLAAIELRIWELLASAVPLPPQPWRPEPRPDSSISVPAVGGRWPGVEGVAPGGEVGAGRSWPGSPGEWGAQHSTKPAARLLGDDGGLKPSSAPPSV